MEETSITIQLANKEYICPLGMVRYVEVLVGEDQIPHRFDCAWLFPRFFLSYHIW
jgi:hypothetical protein